MHARTQCTHKRTHARTHPRTLTPPPHRKRISAQLPDTRRIMLSFTTASAQLSGDELHPPAIPRAPSRTPPLLPRRSSTSELAPAACERIGRCHLRLSPSCACYRLQRLETSELVNRDGPRGTLAPCTNWVRVLSIWRASVTWVMFMGAASRT